jgi:dephospho-CoA kinase
VRVIGLTGGIGSGKTAVSDAFARRGVPVIDTDLIARELVRPGQPALAEIVRHFGADCLTAAGGLNRDVLRRRVFTDSDARHALEAILHPRIRDTVLARIAALDAPYCLVVVPLLAEHPEFQSLTDRILVVDVPESQQIDRVMRRDGVDEAQARAILATQVGRADRLAIADDVIDNSADLDELDTRVAQLHARYLANGS